jgi:CheY-like chemotaxis protein
VESQGTTAVLVVDDDADLCAIVREALEDEGYSVTALGDGRQALALLTTSRIPYVVLLDQRLPGLDGRAILDALAADPVVAGLHSVIIMSGSDPHASGSWPGVSGIVAAHLPKPFDLDGLLDAVARLSRHLAPLAVAEPCPTYVV